MNLTEAEANLVIGILMEELRLVRLDNSNGEYNELTDTLETAIDKVDNWIVSEGYAQE